MSISSLFNSNDFNLNCNTLSCNHLDANCINSCANEGSGIGIFDNITGSLGNKVANFKSLVSGSNISITPSSNSVTITSLPFTPSVEPANTVYSGPSSGVPAIPTFRNIVNNDLPSSGVVANTYNLPTITVDNKGLITSASSNIVNNTSNNFGMDITTASVTFNYISGQQLWLDCSFNYNFSTAASNKLLTLQFVLNSTTLTFQMVTTLPVSTGSDSMSCSSIDLDAVSLLSAGTLVLGSNTLTTSLSIPSFATIDTSASWYSVSILTNN
ncbi:MAG TPA: hypothetical protein VHZ76_04080 [Gammaproteobacteria bacterium]|jgi:hypothetical protein|nr:hypothetical protein [Gammaproteobacteria bacterium]